MGFWNWFTLVALLGALAAYSVFAMGAIPAIGQYYFRAHEQDEIGQFQFILTVIVICAVGAKFIGLEDRFNTIQYRLFLIGL